MISVFEVSELSEARPSGRARIARLALPDGRASDSLLSSKEDLFMEGPLRGCLAGVGAWKLGGGCFSTIIIFIILYVLLGHVKC